MKKALMLGVVLAGALSLSAMAGEACCPKKVDACAACGAKAAAQACEMCKKEGKMCADCAKKCEAAGACVCKKDAACEVKK